MTFCVLSCLFYAIPLKRILCNRYSSNSRVSLIFFVCARVFWYCFAVHIVHAENGYMRCDMIIILFFFFFSLLSVGLQCTDFVSMGLLYFIKQQIDQSNNISSIATFHLDDWMWWGEGGWKISDFRWDGNDNKKMGREFSSPWLWTDRHDS